MNKNSLQFDLNRFSEIVSKIVNNCNGASDLYYATDKMQEIIINNCLQRNNQFDERQQKHFIYLCKYFKEVMENENNNNW